jgi:hypothetical protein
VADPVGVGLRVSVGVLLGVEVWVLVGVWVGVKLLVGVKVLVKVFVGVAVQVPVALPQVAVKVEVKVAVSAGPEGEEGLLLELQAEMRAVTTVRIKNRATILLIFIKSSSSGTTVDGLLMWHQE